MSPPRAARAPFPAGSCSGRPITPPCSRWSARCVTTITSWNPARRPRAATACRRRSRSACCRPRSLRPMSAMPKVTVRRRSRRPSSTGRTPARPIGDAFFRCPSGTPGLGADSTFCFVPNPNLRPEVGKNKEIGFNVRKNGLFAARRQFPRQVQRVPQRCRGLHRSGHSDDVLRSGAAARAAFLASRSSNIRTLPRPGSRASKLETMYDADSWFVGVSGIVSGRQERRRPASDCTASRRRRSPPRAACGCSKTS